MVAVFGRRQKPSAKNEGGIKIRTQPRRSLPYFSQKIALIATLMCGRAAQTVGVANLAGDSLGATPSGHRTRPERSNQNTTTSHTSRNEYEPKDNYNLSPGMDAVVMWKEEGKLIMDRKVWGLVTKSGSERNPLPSDSEASKARMALHFQNLMFNARSDTLFSKPTFSRLLSQSKSCVVALDGYFEWKSSPLAGGKGKKQPYFVHRKVRDATPKESYLLMAGLWTRVSTGIPEEPTLDTFTMLTTEACKQIEWLHHRMPVCIWDMDLAQQWLENPSPKVLQALDQAAKSSNEGFEWHMVTTEMSSVKFRDKAAIQAKKGPKPVTSFFSKQLPSFKKKPGKDPKTETPTKTAENQENKSEAATQSLKRFLSPIERPSPKKTKITKPTTPKKKGQITSFFQKKG